MAGSGLRFAAGFELGSEPRFAVGPEPHMWWTLVHTGTYLELQADWSRLAASKVCALGADSLRR